MLRGFGGFDEDPFFADFREQQRQMNSMFHNAGFGSMMQPYPFMPGMITGGHTNPQHGHTYPQHGHTHPQDGRQVVAQRGGMAPFGMFDNMFSQMNNMMSSMSQNFDETATNPNSHTFSQSSVMTYSNTGNGAPQVYQASSSTRTAPGGIKETRQSVLDSHSGTQKMAVGHHIYDRGHVIEKEKNRRTGEESENQEYLNIEESEAERFHDEWRSKAERSSANRHSASATGRSIADRHNRYDRPRNHYAAITDGRDRENGHRERSPPRASERTPPRPTGPSTTGRTY